MPILRKIGPVKVKNGLFQGRLFRGLTYSLKTFILIIKSDCLNRIRITNIIRSESMKKILLVFSLFFVPFESESITIATVAQKQAQQARKLIQTIPPAFQPRLQGLINDLEAFSQTSRGKKCLFKTLKFSTKTRRGQHQPHYLIKNKKKLRLYQIPAQQAREFIQSLKISPKVAESLQEKIDALERLARAESLCFF